MSKEAVLRRIENAIKFKSQKLDLSFLELTEIPKEIHELKGLKHLDLSYNKISVIENLQGLPLETLNLSGNKITEIKGLEGLPLLVLGLSQNQISMIENLQGLPLRNLTLCRNEVSSIDSLRGLQGLPLDFLHLEKNHLSETEGKYLKKILPKCKVFI